MKQIEIRALRVTSANRTSITPKSAEFLYETDTGFLYIGDGTTAGGNVVSTGGGSVVSSVNGKTGIVTLNSAEIPRTAAGGLTSLTVEAALLEILNKPSLRNYILNGGSSNLPANGTEQFSWGNDAAISGIIALRDGEIFGHTLLAVPAAVSGALSGTIVINGVNQNGANQQIVLNGNVGVDGETVNWSQGFLELVSPIQFNAGDLIHYRGITSAWSNTGSDCSVAIYMRDR